ncbi:hypothetical protein [Luteimonas suaedae]|uniref:hypothetical protein n=1 Tax=Luteimonas suaedae TaxID=2605430 RepID=UPI0011EE1FD6|nr:hypothetical protein [Luteimonas suaedae]
MSRMQWDRLASVLWLSAAAFQVSSTTDALVTMKPANITPKIASERCASGPTKYSFAVGEDAAAYFTTCLIEPGFPTSLHYVRTAFPERVAALRIAQNPPPTMLGFAHSGGPLWASTVDGDRRASRRLNVYRFDPAFVAVKVIASADLPSESSLISAIAGEGCWLLRAAAAQGAEQWAIVAASGDIALVDSGRGERTLFWDDGSRAFVIASDPDSDRLPAFSTLNCRGAREPLRDTLAGFLRDYYSRYNTYFSAPGGDIVWITLGTDTSARLSRSTAAFDVLQDSALDASQLLGSATARVRGFAACTAERGSYAVATDDGIRMFRGGRYVRSLPLAPGQLTGMGFVEGSTDLATFAGFGINLYRMEN